MESDVKLLETTVDISGDTLKAGVTNLEMYYYGGHLLTHEGDVELGSTDGGAFKGFRQQRDGTIQISGSACQAAIGNTALTVQDDKVDISARTLKAGVTSLEVYYYGGHLLTHEGDVELGSTDGGAFKGFRQKHDGTVSIGNEAGGAFKGLRATASGYVSCEAYALIVRNPNVPPADSNLRVALAQSDADELLLNANNHYQGGVKIDGAATVKGDLTVQTTLILPVGSKLLFMTPDRIIRDPVTGRITHLPGAPIDALATIKDLQSKVAELQQHVTALEAKVR